MFGPLFLIFFLLFFPRGLNCLPFSLFLFLPFFGVLAIILFSILFHAVNYAINFCQRPSSWTLHSCTRLDGSLLDSQKPLEVTIPCCLTSTWSSLCWPGQLISGSSLLPTESEPFLLLIVLPAIKEHCFASVFPCLRRKL